MPKRQPMIDDKTADGLRRLASIDVTDVESLRNAAIPELCAGLMKSVANATRIANNPTASTYDMQQAASFQLNVLKALGGLDEVKTQRVVIASELAEVGESSEE